jgi:hypothetical protein
LAQNLPPKRDSSATEGDQKPEAEGGAQTPRQGRTNWSLSYPTAMKQYEICHSA